MDDQPQGVVAQGIDLLGKLGGSLPPVFLMLLLINMLFLGLVLWFIDDQIQQRTELVEKVIEHCLK